MPTLRQIVAAQAAAAEELPLVHTTRCEVLPDIVANNELRSVNPCDVFHEHLIYFFYGRPAYRHALGVNPAGDMELCPVCFVFKPHTISANLKRVYACDSGGIVGQRFEPHLTPPDRDELQLDNTIASARQLVPLVYGSNERYFLGQAHPAVPAAFAAGSPAQRFHALLTDAGPLAADDRRSAIEAQKDSPVPLLQNLLYVLLPYDTLSDPNVRRAIREVWQTDPIGYDFYPGAPANDYVAEIRRTLRVRFAEGGLL